MYIVGFRFDDTHIAIEKQGVSGDADDNRKHLSDDTLKGRK